MQIEATVAKETEKREAEIAKKRGAMQIAQAWGGALSSIPAIWGGYAEAFAPFGLAAPSLIASFGGATTAMVLGAAAANTAQIASSMQSFAGGGVVQQESGVSSTGDNHVIRVNPNEEVLTADDPRHVNNGGGGGNFTINIGNLTQDVLGELEDNIRMLQSSGRTSIDLVS